jgi:hypothetical protein
MYPRSKLVGNVLDTKYSYSRKIEKIEGNVEVLQGYNTGIILGSR